MTTKVILLVEDDWPTADVTKKRLGHIYPDYLVVIIDTELGFRQHLVQIGKGEQPIPAVVICDTRLAWTNPSREMVPPPPDVVEGTFRKAGLRCWKMFREETQLSKCPWIHYSVMSEEGLRLDQFLDSYTSYLEKDTSCEGLFAYLNQLLPRP